jgi:catechol 2,3-dioxygenase-like lactoylglutathione lyase family enzyme
VQLLNDIHHLTFITADMDRLVAFYERVCGLGQAGRRGRDGAEARRLDDAGDGVT